MSAEKAIEILKRLDFLDERFLVGGCVRDIYLGREPKDYDVATPTLPAMVQARAEASGFTVIPVGIQHGTVQIRHPDLPPEGVEVTTYRKDFDQDGRGGKVVFAKTIVADLARRDFTMNAMAMGLDGEILDPFHGTTDLAAGVLHTVGIPEDRFKEDYLRVVRAVRFAADLSLNYASRINLSSELSKASPFVKQHVSVERLVMEINKAWGGQNPGRFFKQLYFLGILQDYVPEFANIHLLKQKPKYHPEGHVLNHVAQVIDNAPPRYRWHAMLHDIGKTLTKAPSGKGDYYSFHGHAEAGAAMIPSIAKRLRMPSWLKKELITTTQYHMQPLDFYRGKRLNDKTIRRFHAAVGEHLAAVEAVVRADRMGREGPDEEFLTKLFTPPPEPVKDVVMGKHLIEAGFKPGPEFTPILKWCNEYHLEHGESDPQKIIAAYSLKNEEPVAQDKEVTPV